ncbi:MAG TPA: PQQ-dependent sugar dehydrogenase [Casimicrobiaceae bacterium]|jgi:glucose/arabinose dehydrogenase
MSIHAPIAFFVLFVHAVLASAAPLSLSPVVAGLDTPTEIVNAGDGSGRLFVLEKRGRIRVVRNGALLPTPMLEIEDIVMNGDERGLLGLAFHPRFATTRYVYVNYTREPDGATVIARYTVPADTPDVADPASAVPLLVVQQPYANHNGGAVRFGRDGYLYVGMGDGGSGNDPQNRAQDPNNLLGKILRLDVDGGAPYAIPPGNMFASPNLGRREIWAMGVRNPWRMAFDPRNGDLWFGDVGQDLREEVDFAAFGAAPKNFGWRVMEGTRCTNLGGGPPCNAPELTPPIAEYTHDEGCSVTGGEIYFGTDVAGSGARYLFADFCNGRTWAVSAPPSGAAKVEVGTAGFMVSSFGRDEWGEVYLADFGGGRVMRLGAATTPGTVPVVEFYRAAVDHYFVTIDPLEVAGLDNGTKGGWARTGLGFRAWTSAVDGAIPICRFYMPPGFGDSHFFSADPAECQREQVENPSFVLESTAAFFVKAPDPATGACADPQTQPLYRIWNRRPGDTNHRYTTSAAVRDQMVAAGGVAEGYGPNAVAMCVPR